MQEEINLDLSLDSILMVELELDRRRYMQGKLIKWNGKDITTLTDDHLENIVLYIQRRLRENHPEE